MTERKETKRLLATLKITDTRALARQLIEHRNRAKNRQIARCKAASLAALKEMFKH